MRKTFCKAILCMVLLAGVTSCSKTVQGPSPLIGQAERLNGTLGALAEESPMYLQTISVDYDNAELIVDIEFADTAVHVSGYSDALVQYVVAQYLKAHPGENLDVVLNTLSQEKGSLKIELSDTHGETKDCSIGATRLKKLYQLKPMELNYNEVKTNVSDILEARCPQLAAQYKAESAEFSISGGFAQYTFTFARPTAYSQLNQASLRGRYLKPLKERYEDFGACRPIIEELLGSLSIDGYRYIYTSKGGNDISAAIPWSMIN